MVESLRKLENRGIKIARVNSILLTKSVNIQLFTLILYDVIVRCYRIRFSVLSPFIAKSMLIVNSMLIIEVLLKCICNKFFNQYFPIVKIISTNTVTAS